MQWYKILQVSLPGAAEGGSVAAEWSGSHQQSAMKILVLDGNENQAVACVRSLARAGHLVRVGAAGNWSKAGWSRFSRGQFSYPAPQENADEFVRAIVREVRLDPAALVLPMTEATTLSLSMHRSEIMEAGGRLELAPHATVLQTFDKLKTTELARSLHIAVPRTVCVSIESQAAEVSGTLRYPVVLKPRASQEVSPTGALAVTGRPTYARSADEFRSAYAGLRARCTQVLVQEFVEGQGAGFFALMRKNELRAEFAHQRIRDVHPTGSGSAVRISVRPDPRLREAALDILRALNWHGVAMVEFRVRSDGTPVFMEINGRFWNSLPLAIYSGVDFPKYIAEMAEYGDMVSSPPSSRPGVRCRWLLGDFRHLIEVLRGKPRGYPLPFPGRLRTLFRFLLPVPGTYHDNFQWHDPLPEMGDWLDFLLRRVPRVLAKGPKG